MCLRYVLILVLSLLFAPPVWAEADLEQAANMAREAAADYKAKRYDAALTKYKKANQLLPNSRLDINIGLCYEKVGRPDLALFHCKIALNAQGMPGPIKKAAKTCVERIQSQLVRPTLKVDSIPSDSTVRVDGRIVGKTPWTGRVSPGLRQLDFEKSGYRSMTKRVAAKYGKTHSVTASLIPLEVGALLSVSSIPDSATVVVDGRVVGETPLTRYPVAARSSVIEVSKTGYASQVMSTTFADGSHLEQQFTLLPVKMKATTRIVRWPGWVLTGLGIAAIGAGGYFGFRAFDERQKADRLARTSGREVDRPAYENSLVDMDQFKLTADLLYTGGLLSLGGGLTILLWPSDDDED